MKSHIVEYYCVALFQYLREYALKFNGESLLICQDDTHLPKTGEPGFPVAAAERDRRVVVSLHEEVQVADHDLASSPVSLMVPGTMGKCVSKDAVFQLSSPMRLGQSSVPGLLHK